MAASVGTGEREPLGASSGDLWVDVDWRAPCRAGLGRRMGRWLPTQTQETATLEIRTEGCEGVALVPGFGAAIVKAEADVALAACF